MNEYLTKKYNKIKINAQNKNVNIPIILLSNFDVVILNNKCDARVII